MKIFNYFSNHENLFLKNMSWKPLSAQQKSVRLIGLAALGLFIATLLYRFYCSTFSGNLKTFLPIRLNDQHSVPKKVEEVKVNALPLHLSKNDQATEIQILKEEENNKVEDKEVTLNVLPLLSQEDPAKETDPVEESEEDVSEGEYDDEVSEEGYNSEIDLDELDKIIEKKNKKSKTEKPKNNIQVFTIDGKRISSRTLECKDRLEKMLKPLNKTYGTAVDNGDCFFDAFAQGLSLYLNRKVSIKELREKVSEVVQKLDEGPAEENWVKQMISKNFIYTDSYEKYKERVGLTHGEMPNQEAPIWGEERREGVILCQAYKVNLKVYVSAYTETDDNDLLWEAINTYPKNEPYPHTIEIGLYPGHFLPVLDNQKDK